MPQRRFRWKRRSMTSRRASPTRPEPIGPDGRALSASCPDSDSRRESAHRRGARTSRSITPRSAIGRTDRARDRRGARGNAAFGGRNARAPRAAPPPAGPRLRTRGHDDPPHRPHRAARGRRNRGGGRRAGSGPDHLRLGRQVAHVGGRSERDRRDDQAERDGRGEPDGRGGPRRRRACSGGITAQRQRAADRRGPWAFATHRNRPYDGIQSDDRRGRAGVAVRYRGGQAARLDGDPPDPRPGPGRAPRGAGVAFRRRARPTARCDPRGSPPGAVALARRHDATLAVLHLVPPGITLAVRAQAERALSAFVRQQIRGRAEPLVREAANVRNAILREAETADLVVMGASAAPGGTDGEGTLFGALPEAIATRARPTVVVVKTRESIGHRTFEQLAQKAETLAAADRAAEEARAVPARVERWFGESNFHHAEFAELRRLVQLKEKQGLTVSLVLPTLNEEDTIGPIVRRAIREMVGRVPLLDEVLVME